VRARKPSVSPTTRRSTAALCLPGYAKRPPRRKGESPVAAEPRPGIEAEAFTIAASSSGLLGHLIRSSFPRRPCQGLLQTRQPLENPCESHSAVHRSACTSPESSVRGSQPVLYDPS